MAGRDDEHGKLLDRLKARRAELEQLMVDVTAARVGKPVQWPVATPAEETPSDDTSATAGATRAGRVIILESEDGLAIHNPALRSWPRLLFLLFWLSAWWMGEAFALREIVGAPSAGFFFLMIWLIVWTIAGLGVSLVVLWHMFGRERLIVVRGDVLQEIGIGPLLRSRNWPPGGAAGFAARFEGRRGIFFAAGGKTRRFGARMSDGELRSTLAALHRHLPPDSFAAEPEAAAGRR